MSLSSYYSQQKARVGGFFAGRGNLNTPTANIRSKSMNSVAPSKKGLLHRAKGVGAMAGPVLAASMIIQPAVSAEGGPGDKFKAGARGMTEMAGFELASSFAGKGVAAAARTKGGQWALGKHASKVAKWGRISKGNLAVLVTGIAAEGAYEFQKHLADIGSRQRMSGLEWGKGSPGMNTQKAYTMRQQSLQQMNRGSMSARSLLGREAQYLHQ